MQDFIGAKGVISTERLAELSTRRNWPGLVQLAGHFGAIAATSWGLSVSWGSWWSMPLFILQGILLNYLYAPTHECDHLTAFKSRWLNIWVARLCGFVIFNPSDHHRWTHFVHHRNTQDWQKDTELERPEIRSAGQYLLALSGFPLIRSKLKRIWCHAFISADEWYLTPSQQQDVKQAARWHVTGYAVALGSALVLQSWWVLVFWWGPFFLMRWSYMLQGLGEHTGLTHQPHTLWNTRTFSTNWFMRWVNWNMTYHCVHHTFPGVPFYRLPTLHREVEQQLGYALPSTSYTKLHWRQFWAFREGRTELDICTEHENQLIAVGRLTGFPSKQA
ncbi:MAG TPA: rhizopine catabolism protein [Gammaproteobacteria bacterium]|jgi:fatty acid desaturase|nr:fatty acid desaturase [Gammaproteobacteria bacterium]PHS08696.1 MAG: rhizopine catabolism protein [Acidithiobacillus sp.]RTZ64483.1 MAG: rhizopine catabolism protein [Gammaproteobacteria bacterium]HAD36462.1 rhizopine catabolism protein [Gammaproteobacteria bacterium]HBK74929.1 rhizopine catabolism protein [Gammaproteobacteria bacterium]